MAGQQERETQLEQRFRDAMARVPAPVSVVTTSIDGVPYGTTVSAFASLSLPPPMVLVALDHRGAMRNRIATAGRLGLNVLASHQADVAVRFASPVDRFAGIGWELVDGVPRLADVAAFLRCDEVELLPGGDHDVVLARVADAEPLGKQALSYHLRTFHPVPHDDSPAGPGAGS